MTLKHELWKGDRKVSMLLNKKQVRRFALDAAKERSHKFTRISKEFFDWAESKLRNEIREYVKRLPSVGVTIK